MNMSDVLLPIFGLIALGVLLSRIGPFEKTFPGDLNKLVFWVAMPALVFRSAAHAGVPGMSSLRIILCVMLASLVVLGLAFVMARSLRLKKPAEGTVLSTVFFGNYAYVGIPVIAHSVGLTSLGEQPVLLSTAMVAMTGLVVLANSATAMILGFGGGGLGGILKIFLNPIVVAGVVGIGYGILWKEIPEVPDRIIRSLGSMTVPAALLALGGSLHLKDLGQGIRESCLASLLKVVALPVLAWLFAILLDLDRDHMEMVLIFAACPSAVVVFTMASQMGADSGLAARTIAISTLLSFFSLAAILLFF